MMHCFVVASRAMPGRIRTPTSTERDSSTLKHASSEASVAEAAAVDVKLLTASAPSPSTPFSKALGAHRLRSISTVGLEPAARPW
eukprot:3651361-Pleurochrysis_carterae.AAC.2